MTVSKIDKFVIDTEKDPYIKSKDLVNYLDNQVKDTNFQKFIDNFSKITNLPSDVIAFEIKQILVRGHNFETGRFKSIFNFYNIFKSSAIFFVITLYILIFSKKRKKEEKFDIIFDEIESIEEFKRTEYLKKKFNSCKIISSKIFTKDENIFFF